MYFLQCLLTLFWMLVVPFLVGTLVINQLFKEKKTDALLAVVCGVICMLAIFYVFVIPMMFLRIPLHILMICWGILILTLSGMAIYLNMKQWKDIINYNFQQIKAMPWFAILVIVLVVGQAFILAGYTHDDDDDAFFVAAANTDATTDTIFQYDPYTGLLYNPSEEVSLASFPSRYVMSPFPTFIALVSKLVQTHPAIVAHTIIPAIFIPLSYTILAVLGKRLFSEKPAEVMLFLLFLCIINIFGFISIYTNSTFLLFRIWQGKAVLANIVLPAILYFAFRAMPGKAKIGEWTMLFACALTACLTSSMGIVLAPIMIGCLGLVFAIRDRTIQTLIFSLVCCSPCIVGGIVNVAIKYLIK